jgi:hypothetical protein
MAMGRGLIVPRAHAAVVLREPSGTNALMPARTRCSSARTLCCRVRTESHGRGRNATGTDDIFGYIYVYSMGADVSAAGVDGNDSCSDGHGRNVNGRGRNKNGHGQNINGRGRNINGRGQYINGRGWNINGHGRYRNGRGREKNRRPRNHDGRGRNHNGRGLEKCWLPCGSMRTHYNNFLQDMHLQEENIIEKQKSKRKKLVVGGRIYLLIFIQKICNTFS